MATATEPTTSNHLATATPADTRAVGLSYSCDADDGIRRRKVRSGFRYETADGEKVEDERILERIRALVI
ncbi:MAG: DNA topoisomerase IB, partial [Chloroflexota bacterium]|nr:DNA topoisomerase IB [Chloroflexota bacterium]